MQENKSLNEQKEQVIIYPQDRIIKISYSRPEKAYGLFDSQTGTQVSDFVKGTGEQVEFIALNPLRHYDVGVIEGSGDEKPQFAISWNPDMRDITDSVLNNSGSLPVEYPYEYVIRNNENGSNGVFDLVDKNNEPVGQVANLSLSGDKPEFEMVWSFRMKDDTKE